MELCDGAPIFFVPHPWREEYNLAHSNTEFKIYQLFLPFSLNYVGYFAY